MKEENREELYKVELSDIIAFRRKAVSIDTAFIFNYTIKSLNLNIYVIYYTNFLQVK